MSKKKYIPITKDTLDRLYFPIARKLQTHVRLYFRGFSLLKEKKPVRHDCNLINFLPNGELGEKNQFEREWLNERVDESVRVLFPEDDRSAQARMTDDGKKCPPPE